MKELIIISACYVLSCIGIFIVCRSTTKDRERKEFLRGHTLGHREAIDFALKVINREPREKVTNSGWVVVNKSRLTDGVTVRSRDETIASSEAQPGTVPALIFWEKEL